MKQQPPFGSRTPAAGSEEKYSLPQTNEFRTRCLGNMSLKKAKTAPKGGFLERMTGFEPATLTLAR